MKNKMAASRQTNLSAQVKEIRKEYCDTLDSLTFNSKPIIDTLSEIAKDYARSIPQIGPPTVVKVIEERIMRVSFLKENIILQLFHLNIPCHVHKPKYPGLKSSLNERNEVHGTCFWIISEDTIFFDEKFCEIDSFHFTRLVLNLGYFF